MLFRCIRLIGCVFTLTLFAPAARGVVQTQEPSSGQQQVDSDESIIRQADEDLRLWETSRDLFYARRAERRLKDLLRRHPDSPLRERAEKQLAIVREAVCRLHLFVAQHYLGRVERHGPSVIKRAETRLRLILCDYPGFSQIDEVLEHLLKVYSLMGNIDAEGYVQRLIKTPPDEREYGKACEEIQQFMGVELPQQNR